MNGEGEYDMCQALRELMDESMAQGSAEKTRIVVQNMLKRGFSDEDICALAECTVEFIDSAR